MLQGMGGWRGPLLFTDFCAAHLWLQDTRFANGIWGEELVLKKWSRDQRARVPQKIGVFVLKETGVDQTIQLYG